MLLLLIVLLVVHVVMASSQQTPKPAAHVPTADPDFDVHSVEVKHVPVRLEVVVHASLGNWTTENKPMGLVLTTVNSAKIF